MKPTPTTEPVGGLSWEQREHEGVAETRGHPLNFSAARALAWVIEMITNYFFRFCVAVGDKAARIALPMAIAAGKVE